MKCPKCGSPNTYVYSGRPIENEYRRYRKCADCGKNFISTESYVPVKRGKLILKYCKWCGRELKSWYLTYKGNCFCRYNDDACLKNYLYEEADSEIKEDRGNGDVEYDMSEVAESDGF